jgi:hypothetical protein
LRPFIAGDWSALVVLVLCGCCVLTSVAFLMRASFYRWWLTSLIQLDSRYNAQPEWHRYWKRASIGGLVMPVVILVVYLSVFGPG